VDRATRRTLLGFGFYVAPGGHVRLRLAASTITRFKRTICDLTAHSRGISIQTVIADVNRYGVAGPEACRLASSSKDYWALAHTPQLNQALRET